MRVPEPPSGPSWPVQCPLTPLDPVSPAWYLLNATLTVSLGRPLRGSWRAATWLWQAATRLEAGRYAAMAGRYAARGGPLRGYGGPLRGYGGPLRGSRRAATRRPPNHDEASTRCRYAAQVYHTRPKLFYEAQGAAKYVRRISVLFASPPPSRRSRSECGALPAAPWRATELQVRTAYTRSSVPCRVLDHHPQPSARPRP